MRSQKGPLLIRRLSGCTIKACLAPPSLGGNACKTPCKCCMVTPHLVKRLRKGCMVVLHPVKRPNKCCIVTPHTATALCRCCIVTLHTVKGLCRCCMVISHTVEGPRRCCMVISHTVKGLRRCCMVISHTVEGLRRCCTLVSHTAPACARGERRFTPPSGDHSGHCSSSSLTVRPSVGWTIVGAISASGSRTKRRRCISGWGRVRRGVSRQVSA